MRGARSTVVTIDAWGAQGGGFENAGGLGGHDTGTVTVSPGEVLSVFVGGSPLTTFATQNTTLSSADIGSTTFGVGLAATDKAPFANSTGAARTNITESVSDQLAACASPTGLAVLHLQGVIEVPRS